MLLTNCTTIEAIPADKHNECQKPEPPESPYTDTLVAKLILNMDAIIGKCRALLGHKD